MLMLLGEDSPNSDGKASAPTSDTKSNVSISTFTTAELAVICSASIRHVTEGDEGRPEHEPVEEN